MTALYTWQRLRIIYGFAVALALPAFSPAYAHDDKPPIPPERPKVMSVSPEYIKSLMNRQHKSETGDENAEPAQQAPGQKDNADLLPLPDEQTNKQINAKPKTADKPDSQKADDDNVDGNALHDATRQEVLNILEGKTKGIPIPPEKPESFTGDEEAEGIAVEDKDDKEKTIISFSLPPKEIALSKDIENFLQTRVLPKFKNDAKFELEIYAYATKIDGEEHSAIRISLARALEVRRWLIDNNVPPSRLKLSHMGSGKDMKPDDRIDLILIE